MRGIVYLLVVVGVAAGLYLQGSGDQNAANALSPSPQPGESESNLVFDISVHSVDEMRKVLARVDQLMTGPRSASQPANIALLLHGQEIEYFTIDKYDQYRDIVDLSAKLDAYNVIEFKMCETAMKDFGVEKSDIPGFIEFVPNGDRELEQLSRKGYAIM